MDRIHLGQVPRNSRGHINYKIIPSVMVKVMVAEEELKQLNHRLNRHHNPNDSFYYPHLECRLYRKAFLEKWLLEWKMLLNE